MKNIDSVLQKYENRRSNIIQILEDIQRLYNYLPKDVLRYIEIRLKIPLSIIYSIATFYSTFSLKPRGKHLITVCMGTACHVQGSATILNEFKRRLKINPGENTPDMKYTLETVNCLGCCAIGPIVVYNQKYLGEFKLKDIPKVLEEKA